MSSVLPVDRVSKFKQTLRHSASPAELLEFATAQDGHSAREEKTDVAMRQAAKELLEEMGCKEIEE